MNVEISGGQKELLELKACIEEMGFHIRSIEFSQKEKGIVKAVSSLVFQNRRILRSFWN